MNSAPATAIPIALPTFFQAPPADVLVRRGAEALLAEATSGVAETEGAER